MSARRCIDFYFDLASPYSYLAHVKLPALARRHGYELDYHPIDIPAAKLAAGNYGPSNREVPAKIRLLTADLQRWARHYGVPLNFPKGFGCGEWNIGVLFALEHGRAEPYVNESYRRIWGEGIDPSDEGELRAAAQGAGLDPDGLFDYVNSSRGRTEFRKACVVAHKRGVFGAPIMMLDDEVWWGNDRLHFVEEYLRSCSAREQGDVQHRS